MRSIHRFSEASWGKCIERGLNKNRQNRVETFSILSEEGHGKSE